jgi:hypothetical protein
VAVCIALVVTAVAATVPAVLGACCSAPPAAMAGLFVARGGADLTSPGAIETLTAVLFGLVRSRRTGSNPASGLATRTTRALSVGVMVFVVR